MKCLKKFCAALLLTTSLAGSLFSIKANPNLAHKVTFIGPAGVGKTSLIVRMLENDFYQGISPTIGLGTAYRKLSELIDTNQDQDQVEFWDTAGQEKYGGFLPFYMRNSVIIVVVVDQNVSEERVKEFKELAENAIDDESRIIFVRNKVDLGDYDIKDGEIHCSALTGKGVKELKDEICNKIINHRDEIVQNKAQKEVVLSSERKLKNCC